MSRSAQKADRVSEWCRSQTSRWMVVGGGVLAVALVVAGVLNQVYAATFLPLLLAPVAIVATGAVKVTVSRDGVTVASTVFPFFRKRIPLSAVQEANARWTKPTELGGWGYRWRPGVRAVSLREGDALWLTLTRGSSFVITVDDAGTAAELINGHLAAGRGRR